MMSFLIKDARQLIQAPNASRLHSSTLILKLPVARELLFGSKSFVLAVFGPPGCLNGFSTGPGDSDTPNSEGCKGL